MDDSFGPRLLGHFDFTLLFEHTMLQILPGSIVIFATPFYIYTLISATAIVRSGPLLWTKLASALALVAIQIANAVLWSESPFESRVALAAAAISCISAACMATMVVVGHRFFLRPPSFLGMALTVTMIFDVCTTWTYFHRNGLETIARLHVPIPLLKLVLICLEEVSKRSLIRSEALRSSLGHEAFAGFWNRSLLLWVNPLLTFGFRQEITMELLPGIGPHLEAESLYQNFRHRWNKTNKMSKFALVKACACTIPWPFFYIILPRLLFIGFNFAQPFLLQDVVSTVAADTETPTDVIRGLILATTAIYVGRAVSKSWYIHLRNQIMIGVRSMLISAIYHKSLSLPTAADELADSAAVTLMSADVTGVGQLISLSYESWARLLEMALGIGILVVFVGAAAIITVVPTVVTSVGSAYVARGMMNTRKNWNEHMQDRVAETSNILAQIKDIKMLGLNPILADRLQKQFENEVKVSMATRQQIAATFGISDFAQSMTPVLVVAGTIFWTRASEPISAARFFTTLAVVTLVSGPLASFVHSFGDWSSGFACLRRIQHFLNLPETEDTRQFAVQAAEDNTPLPGAVSRVSSNLRRRHRVPTTVVEFAAQMIRVSVRTDKSSTVLNDVSINASFGSVTMVCGPVGCGKSTLLRTLLGEVPIRCGTVTLASLSVAYCAQVPWIQNTTIRNNILGGRQFNAVLYQQVLHICALDVDIARLPARDQTLCGSEGSNLSGGQKQRISLARTLFSQAELLILDDPFSSLDLETSSTIRIRLFSESDYLANTMGTIIMTTSMRQHLVDADTIYKMDDNGQVGQKTLQQIESEAQSRPAANIDQATSQGSNATDSNAGTATDTSSAPPEVKPTASSSARDNFSNKKYGDFTLYKYFLKPAGLFCVLLWLTAVAIAAVSERMPQIYARFWLERDANNLLYYIGYAGLGLIAPILSYLAAFAFFHLVNLKSAPSLHWTLLDSTNRATFEFLAEQDAGALLNRFSQDISMATQELPMAIMPTVWGFVSLFIDVSIISSGASYATPIIPFFLLVLFLIQHFYLRTSRQLRILELDSSKNLVRLSTESGAGAEHIRALQLEEDFVRQFYLMLDESQKPIYFLYAIQQWLTSAMDFVTAAAAVCVVSLALNFKKSTSATAMGLSLLGLITFSVFTAQTIVFFVAMENTFGAVARIRDFARMTPTETERNEEVDKGVKNQWLSSGRLDLNCVSAVYKADSEKPHVALENITVTVQPGQTVGLIGRTGSGKTSVMLALLHLLEYTGNIYIDGEELRTIPRTVLRNRITTITQGGIELRASVRFNMDPLEFSSRPGNFPTDDTLAGILRRVGLWDHVLRNGGLDAPMRAMKFSVGQKQLFQLARAMLHRQVTRSKLVLIDEGTASMDEDTEARMFHLMREAFAGCTMVVISHRQALLADADLVLSMDDGRGVVYQPQQDYRHR